MTPKQRYLRLKAVLQLRGIGPVRQSWCAPNKSGMLVGGECVFEIRIREAEQLVIAHALKQIVLAHPDWATVDYDELTAVLAHEAGHAFTIQKSGYPWKLVEARGLPAQNRTLEQQRTIVADETAAWLEARKLLKELGIHIAAFDRFERESLDSYIAWIPVLARKVA